MPDTVYEQFQKKLLCVSDKRVDLDGIRLDAGKIALTIQWYEQILVVSVSDLFYRLYYENPSQSQSHTQLVHGKTSTNQIYGTVERHTPVTNKTLSLSESLHGNDLQWKLNSGKELL